MRSRENVKVVVMILFVWDVREVDRGNEMLLCLLICAKHAIR